MGIKKKKFKTRKKSKSKKPVAGEQPQVVRVRTPKGNQTIGILEQRLGGSRMGVRCLDGKTRMCRIPGGLKKFLWVREGDILLVEPWKFEGDAKGDVIYKYRFNQVGWLRSHGYLEGLEEFEEF